MTAAPLDRSSPFPRRFLAWMAERFPAKNGVMCLLVWSAAMAWGRFHAVPGPIVFEPRDVAGFLAAYGYFFMLRVFDEHKDYADDLVAHPGRVLQRGLITLGNLRAAGAVAIAAQLGVSLWLDGGVGSVTLAWLATFAWSLLMAREFFVGEWLRPRLVLYAFSHMVAMPLAVHWMVRMGSGPRPLPLSAFLLPATSYAYGFAIEIARKLKAPEEERPEVDSYTRALGTRRAPAVLSAVVFLVTAGFVAMIIVASGGPAGVGNGLVALAAGAAFLACGRFRVQPTPARAKACETAVGVVVLLDHVTLLVVLALARSFAWS